LITNILVIIIPINYWVGVNAIESERSYAMGKKRKAAKKKRAVKGLWSKSEVGVLKRLFSNNPTAEIASKLGRPTEAVKKKASRMGLRKSKRYMKSLGRS